LSVDEGNGSQANKVCRIMDSSLTRENWNEKPLSGVLLVFMVSSFTLLADAGYHDYLD
jgi:hypothetical protein